MAESSRSLVTPPLNKEALALKIMQSRTTEFEVIKALKSYSGFPKIINRFTENEYECATMTLFGINLKSLKMVCNP